MKGDQLALAVQLQQTPSFETFFPGPNAALVEGLRQFAASAVPEAIWLYGAQASGKTHLLRATLAAAGEGAIELPLASARLGDLAAVALSPVLAIDGFEAVAADPSWSLDLLRLIDLRRAQRLPLLITANAPPARLGIALPDLLTRLGAMALLGLKPLRESDRRELLRLHAQARGLELPEDAASWLLVHLQRDAGTLIGALEELDRATLSAKRRPTLPFVQQILGPRIQPSLALESGQTSSG